MPVAFQALLATLLMLPIQWDVATRERLRQRVDALRKAGQPVTMAELAKTLPDVPAEENAAPLLERAFKEIEARGEDPEDKDDLVIMGYADHPPLGKGLTPRQLEVASRFLQARGDALRLLHQAAAKSDCRFRLDLRDRPGLILDPRVGDELSWIHDARRLLALEAVERVERGLPVKAAESLLACSRVGSALRHEPFALSAGVTLSGDRMTVRWLERCASRTRFPPESLSRLQQALRRDTSPRRYQAVLAGERCTAIAWYRQLVLSGDRWKLYGALLGVLLDTDVLLAVIANPRERNPRFQWAVITAHVLSLAPQTWYRQDMLTYLDGMAEVAEATREPYPEWLPATRKAAEAARRKAPKALVFCQYFLNNWVLDRVPQETQATLALTEAARSAMAVLRHKDKHGKLVDRLGALVPEYLDAVPVDPFDGGSLRFRAEPNGFVIYSVGENGKDDGGPHTLEEEEEARRDDIGFRVRWPKAEF